jgi:hypothetical protein
MATAFPCFIERGIHVLFVATRVLLHIEEIARRNLESNFLRYGTI